MEALLQSYLYDKAGAFDIDAALSDPHAVTPEAKELAEKYHSVSKTFIEFWRTRVNYDENFANLLDATEKKIQTKN